LRIEAGDAGSIPAANLAKLVTALGVNAAVLIEHPPGEAGEAAGWRRRAG
jgi:hypothetical protein